MDMKEFACKDVGFDCDWKTTGKTEEEVMKQATEHGREKHGIREMTDELKNKVKSKIHERKVA